MIRDWNMDKRQKAVVAVLLVLMGAAFWAFVVRPLMGPPAVVWEAQIRQDSIDLIQVIRPDPWVEDAPGWKAKWGVRKSLYDQAHLDELRARLLAFVEFELAEYAEARDIYRSGRYPERPTEAARAAQERLREAYGDEAQKMIDQFRNAVREPAFRASPAVAQGVDPDLPKYDELHERILVDWAPKARARVAELTAR